MVTDGVLAIFVLIAKIQLTTVTIYVSYKIDLLQTEIVNDTATTDAHGQSTRNSQAGERDWLTDGVLASCVHIAKKSINKGNDPC